MSIISRTGFVAVLAGAVIFSAAACSSSDDEGTNTSSSPPPGSSTSSASAACAAGGDVTLTGIDVTVDGTTRTAVVHVASGATGTDPLPVVLSFHGGGELAENRPEVDGFMTLGDQHGFVSVYPQGLVGDAGPVSGVTGWDIEATAVDEPAFVAALLDELGAQVCIDESHVYAAGMSNGGAMALLLASGSGFAPVLDVMAARAAINGCTAPVVLYTLDDHGHAWPGHPLPVSQDDLASYIPPSISGAMTADDFAANMLLTNIDIDASDLIWEFFDSSSG